MISRIIKIALILSLIATPVFASSVGFIWDPNVEPDLAGYRMYKSSTSMNYVRVVDNPDTENLLVDIPCGPNDTTCSTYKWEDVPDGTYFWIVTAYDTEGHESGFSNEVTATINASPKPPQNFSIWDLIVAWLQDLFDGAKFKIKKG